MINHRLQDNLTIKFLSVFCGDSILLKFTGNDGCRHNVLIDGGFVKTYRRILLPELREIKADGEVIDLVVGTHLDGDHIGGIIAFVNDKQFDIDDFVLRWIINFDVPLLSPDGEISVSQLDSLNKKLAYSKNNVRLATTTQTKPIDLYGLSLTVISPDSARYQALQEVLHGRLTQINSRTNDYGRSLEDFRLAVAQEAQEDDSEENGSSIAFLAEYRDDRFLLLADAFPSVVCESLRKLNFSEKNLLKLNFIKLSHHGSRANLSSELLSLVRTNAFVISGNAVNNHNLPNKETICRILLNGTRDEGEYFHFYFTHDNSQLRSMFDVDGPEIYELLKFKMHFSDQGATGIIFPF